MKRKLFLLAAATGILFMSNQYASAQNNIKSIVKQNKASIAPFEYECYAAKEITYGPKEKSVVVEFSVYSDEEFKLLFCKTKLPQSVEIYIYDRNPKNKHKKLLYFDDSGMKDQYVCNFRPTESGQYFIEYKVPPASAPNQKGSIIVLIGVIDFEEELAKQ